jgi:D-lactate dehydrogenase
MRVTVFSTHLFDRTALQVANRVANHELIFCEHRLSEETVGAAAGSVAVCLFANDDGSKALLTRLSSMGVKLIALRTAGFNHVDIETTLLMQSPNMLLP